MKSSPRAVGNSPHIGALQIASTTPRQGHPLSQSLPDLQLGRNTINFYDGCLLWFTLIVIGDKNILKI